MLTPGMKAIVERQRLGFVATVSAAGEPNLSPKGTFVVIDDRTLAFGEIRSPATIANLRERPALDVNMVDPLSRKGFRASGRATVHERGGDAFAAHRPRFDRWGALADRIRAIVLIEVRAAAPLSSPAYDDGATEAELRAQWAGILLGDP
ncbi:pyridoxamine 5'-phosphate oxidase family protein [Methylobacterium oryzihabitans]|uniref:Pyridoxamine 5'-phosphate oxidase family protein n=1 Tax=Methylobacterium oryzihabitans TaxID=2499852 RepID=A0A3S2V571_9HYPH|nr:pyridoxamine 5'-phosphate oxidase family protein [Methylobacterium oryzihabitans]RVU14524.1 pyridoxamine 5'-phosphate oxidase family protein [Methylobacterium oryzihabitans]